jgi:hypothetical protein
VKKLHPQLSKYCKSCLENRRGKVIEKRIVEYLDEQLVRSHVRLCPHCDAPGVLTIYDLDPHGMMP